MQFFAIILSVALLFSISTAQATTTDTGYPMPTLPSYMHINCGQYSPDPDSLLTTIAKMMDWCGCENYLNPGSQYVYSGMSAYDDSFSYGDYDPARTYACSADSDVDCSTSDDWYHALGNVSAQCGKYSGYMYDAKRQIAWGFDAYQNVNYCENIGWIGISGSKREES